MGEPAKEIRLFTSLRRLFATALELAQVRLDLVSTEVELEKRRIFDGLLWGAVAVVVLTLGLALACLFVLLIFWDSHRLLATGFLASIFLAGGILLLLRARMQLRSSAGMFSLSVLELERDLSQLKSSNHHEQQ